MVWGWDFIKKVEGQGRELKGMRMITHQTRKSGNADMADSRVMKDFCRCARPTLALIA